MCASSPVDGGAQMDLIGEAVTLHARRGVDRVSEQTVARHLFPNYTCQDGTTVETHSDLQRYTVFEYFVTSVHHRVVDKRNTNILAPGWALPSQG